MTFSLAAAIPSAARWLRAVSVAAVVAAAALVSGGGASAQNSSAQDLANRIDRLQRELVTLQRHVYRGEPPPAAPSAAAASSGAGEMDPRMAARLEVRMTQLEDQLRNLTGRTEEMSYAVQQFNQRLEKIGAELGQRLTALESRGAAPADGQAPGVQPPVAGQPPAGATANPPPPPGNTGLGAPPRTLGTVDQRLVDAQKSELARAAPAQPARELSPQEQYDQAISLMLKDQNFDAAEKALRSFIERNPKSDLADNAHYWLGETYYVRKDYQQAAFSFAEAFQKYPKSTKAPENLFKLGMALAQLGKTKEACTAFSRLIENFPDAPKSLGNRVTAQQRQLSCR